MVVAIGNVPGATYHTFLDCEYGPGLMATYSFYRLLLDVGEPDLAIVLYCADFLMVIGLQC